MSDLRSVDGHLLATALTEQPSLTLSFYSYGVIMRKREGDMFTEYAVDPAHVASALAAKVTFDTGLIADDMLLVRQEGVRKIVVGFRKAQKTGIYLDGAETALRVPLPPLLLIRVTSDDSQPSYHVYAVKKRPTALDVPLFHAPLPNVFQQGGICWGNVQRPAEEALRGGSLRADWQMLLGSPFGDHAVSNKSSRFPADIRRMFIDLEARKARVYPKSDLIPVKKTLADLLGGDSS